MLHGPLALSLSGAAWRAAAAQPLSKPPRKSCSMGHMPSLSARRCTARRRRASCRAPAALTGTTCVAGIHVHASLRAAAYVCARRRGFIVTDSLPHQSWLAPPCEGCGSYATPARLFDMDSLPLLSQQRDRRTRVTKASRVVAQSSADQASTWRLTARRFLEVSSAWPGSWLTTSLGGPPAGTRSLAKPLRLQTSDHLWTRLRCPAWLRQCCLVAA